MSFTVLLEDEHVESLQKAREVLAKVSDLGVPLGLVVDDLGEILDRARAERSQSVRADLLWQRAQTLSVVRGDGA